ncbi:substrate-binding periplasmic protein [Fluctibacter halophilus]|uniref:substrate-binding periplasmic protein n=1 Tax=Fluctibacter halophilus TaxID=226011 RepID=UPI001E41FA1D|nr:transporter substrate-binding domain-containing protein [Aestuariibacter halophilus]
MTAVLLKGRTLARCLAVLMLLQGSCHALAAIPKQDALLQPDDVRVNVATGDNYFPYASADVLDGGWSLAIVRAVFARMHTPLNIDVLPWARGFKWSLDHKYLGTFPYVYNQERGEQFLYSDPINFISVELFVAADSAIHSEGDIHGLRLCMPMGYSVTSAVGSLVERYQLVLTRAADTQGCFAQVEKGWADVGVINRHFHPQHLRNIYHIEQGIRVVPVRHEKVPLYFIIAKDYPEAKAWMARFNRALDSLQQDGSIDAINQRYTDWLTAPPQP